MRSHSLIVMSADLSLDMYSFCSHVDLQYNYTQ